MALKATFLIQARFHGLCVQARATFGRKWPPGATSANINCAFRPSRTSQSDALFRSLFY